MRPSYALSLLAVGLVALAAAPGCNGGGDGDTHQPGPPPTPVGSGNRVRDVSNPDNQGPSRGVPGATVSVTGVTVVAVDTFDETRNGKSRGTIFVQDTGSTEPYSGIGLFAPTFVPGDLKVGPGDVLDLTGQYQENANIGTAVFPKGQVLPQISRPVSTFRFEAQPPTPREIDVADLNDYAKGRRWIGMLVTVKNVTLEADLSSSSGRVSGPIFPGAPNNGPTITNELYDLGGFAKGQKFKSITGVVTYFFNLHIAPRSREDLVTQ